MVHVGTPTTHHGACGHTAHTTWHVAGRMLYMVFANWANGKRGSDMRLGNVKTGREGLADVRDMPLPPGLPDRYVTFAWPLGSAAVVVKASPSR
jgi:hypothetical protein